jgi:hypothetical protein
MSDEVQRRPRGRPKIGEPVFTRLKPATMQAMLDKCKLLRLTQVAEGMRTAVESWVQRDAEVERLRAGIESVIRQLDDACKHRCEDWRPYKTHSPDCFHDLADELRDAVSSLSQPGRK